MSIQVEAAPITQPEVAPAALAQACQQMLNDDVPWAENHLAAWDEVFKAFGAKPKRTPCSASALRQRGGRNLRLGNRGGFNLNAQRPKAGRDPDKSRIY
ncbi:hypothetical protein AWI25_13010 [Enterobacter hormaechei subsp. oharae]|nr:hypothetical protein AWI25_13010 [Enterobacter hormaechei subsp. oharae]